MTETLNQATLATLGDALALRGRTVAITGASSGIGEAVATCLAGMGVNVVGISRRGDELDRVGSELARGGLRFLSAPADVTNEAQIEAAMTLAVDTFGSLDGVVANAGITVVKPAMDITADEFRSVVDTNITGAFLTARTAARKMTGGGAVVFTSSSFARHGFTDWAVYNATKAAVSMLAETLACEWIGRRIRVNALAPTATLTDVNRALFADADFTAGVVSGIPAGRILQATELGLPVAFLLSPRNELLIGHTLFVDGGQSL